MWILLDLISSNALMAAMSSMRLLVVSNQKHQVSWFWVKGHSGDKGNDMADLLANQAMDNF
jgi:ribonuclease HI